MVINNFQDYLIQTKKAIQDTFALLESYSNIIKSIPTGLWLLTEEQLNNPKVEIKSRLEKESEYIDNLFSENSISGLILQCAYIAINLYSKIKDIPPGYEALNISKDSKKIIKYFIGREIEEVPQAGAKIEKTKIGLIIYAGRNQWAHPLEEKLYHPNDLIFNRVDSRISFYSRNIYTDPAYNIFESKKRIFASNILDLLGWHNYKDYEKDMIEMAKDFKIINSL